MNGLSRHLIEVGSHAHLPFQVACPACRAERLAGALPSTRLLPPSATAGLAAAVLATSALPPAAAPAPAAAAEQDQGSNGAVDPGAGAPADTDGVDPGDSSGANTPLSEQPSVAGGGTDDGAGGADEPGALEPEAPDADEGIPTGQGRPSDGAGSSSGIGARPDGGSEVGKGKDPEPAGGGSEQPGSGRDSEEVSGVGHVGSGSPAAERRKGVRDRGQSGGRDEATRPERPKVFNGRGPQLGDGIGRTAAGTYAAPVSNHGPASAAIGFEGPASASSDSNARREARPRFHVVRPGESLWSIALGLLGEHATSADIAREVDRIWRLNASAIGTGDPDLVMVGQRLRLR